MALIRFELILTLPQRSDCASEPYTNVLTASRTPPAQKSTVLSDGDVSSGRLRVRLLRSARRDPCGCARTARWASRPFRALAACRRFSVCFLRPRDRVSGSLRVWRRSAATKTPATMMRPNRALVLNTPEALNNKVKLIVRRAFGQFHSARAALALILLACGPITLTLPHGRFAV
jgi:hypothetical protein